MIGIIDYGLGNIGSIVNMLKKLHFPASLVSEPKELKEFSHLILPGVGHFDRGMRELRRKGFEDSLNEAAFDRATPVLGICLGMQLLLEGSEEGSEPGLGWIKGYVKRFPETLMEDGVPLKVPNMGWNEVSPRSGTKLFNSWDGECRFYFVHSYFADPVNESDVAGVSEYGQPFVCAVERGNIMGCQFHPEKSHVMGMRLLNNVFSE